MVLDHLQNPGPAESLHGLDLPPFCASNNAEPMSRFTESGKGGTLLIQGGFALTRSPILSPIFR